MPRTSGLRSLALRQRTVTTVIVLVGSFAALMIVPQATQAQTFTVLHRFLGAPTDGAFPDAGLIRDSAGNTYGTTDVGGSGPCNTSCRTGIVYKLDPTGKETVLHNFTGGSDGGNPQSRLLRDAAGNLYGTTTRGGAGTCDCGTLFKLDITHKLIVLHTFHGKTDGAVPFGSLVSINGNIFGTTASGGNTGCGGFGCGVIYKVSPTGAETILYRFTGGADGALPTGLIHDPIGDLYGTTAFGGIAQYTAGMGTLFKRDTTGHFSVLHRFTGGADGASPQGSLTRDVNGFIYGVTTQGGIGHDGVLFVLRSPTDLHVVHSFFPAGGDFPEGGVLDLAATFYGTTTRGEGTSCTDGCGVVYRVSNTGQYSVLYRFGGARDGSFPVGELIGDGRGNLYGVTQLHGIQTVGTCCGVVFKITP
jgi:uncharacterized repeat protein (TIGR03803 family)